jgi:hypothetical protein
MDGLSIRWRETAPDRALISMALTQLDELHGGSRDAMQCEILIERVGLPERVEYHARIDLGGGVGRRARDLRVQADALSSDPARALRRAFRALRSKLPTASQSQAA